MSGGNTTIYGLATFVGTPAASFRFVGQQTATTDAVGLTASQVANSVFAQMATIVTIASGGTIQSSGNFTLGAGTALATNATVGYIMITSCAGTPTGVPVGFGTGNMPIQYDTTNNKLWVYAASGAWRGVALL